jgi:NAD kinase
MVLVPLASHTLINRSLVTAPEDHVRIELPEPRHADAALSIDGDIVIAETANLTHIDIALSSCSVSLVKLDTRLFFDTLATEFFQQRD